MEQEAPLSSGRRDSVLRWSAVCAALLQMLLAWAAHTYSAAGICPAGGGGSACAPLIRPRVAALGPASVSQVALVGAAFAVGLAFLLAIRKASRGLRRGGALTLAAGAGFAVGLQALPWRVSGALCSLCLAVVVSACLTAALVGYVAARGAERAWRQPALACVLALAFTAPLAFLRADSLLAEDAVRLAALAGVGGQAGPRLILVTRPGCPYCDAFRVDSLGDPRVIEALRRTRGVQEVRQGSREARQHGVVHGVPTLFALDANGQRLGLLEGQRPVSFVLAWLREVTGPRR